MWPSYADAEILACSGVKATGDMGYDLGSCRGMVFGLLPLLLITLYVHPSRPHFPGAINFFFFRAEYSLEWSVMGLLF